MRISNCFPIVDLEALSAFLRCPSNLYTNCSPAHFRPHSLTM